MKGREGVARAVGREVFAGPDLQRSSGPLIVWMGSCSIGASSGLRRMRSGVSSTRQNPTRIMNTLERDEK
jgi:hypothetical protein